MYKGVTRRGVMHETLITHATSAIVMTLMMPRVSCAIIASRAIVMAVVMVMAASIVGLVVSQA